MKVADCVKISLPILEETNQFSRLNLKQERVNQIPCFSNAVIDSHSCNPDIPPEADEPVCAIHWICKVYLAGRLGVGLKPNEPYDFEKSKEFAKKLTYEKLMEAIRAKRGELLEQEPEVLEADSIKGEQEQEAALKPVEDKPAPKVVKNQDATGPVLTKDSIGQHRPGSQGHFILANLVVGTATPKDNIWKLVSAKGWSSEKTFEKTLTKLVEDGLLVVVENTLTRKS